MSTHRVVTAHIPKELALRVDQLSARLDRPRGWVLKEALEQYLALERERHALTLEALADVRAGRLTAHAEVEAWAASLRTPRRRKAASARRRR